MNQLLPFLTKPVYGIDPMVILWSVVNGVLIIFVLRALNVKASVTAVRSTAIAAASASILWHWGLAVSKAAKPLSIAHPLLRVTFADVLNGVCVFALTALFLSLFVCRKQKSQMTGQVALVAALVTIVVDTMLM